MALPATDRPRLRLSGEPTLADLIQLLRTRAAWFHQDQTTLAARGEHALARDAGLKASAIGQIAHELESRRDR